MKLSDFDYDLPKELIAQRPLKNRSESKLMVLNSNGFVSHKYFKDVVDYFSSGDVLVINDTKVEPVKLCGEKITGAKCVFIVSKKIDDVCYECEIKSNKVRVGDQFVFCKETKDEIVGTVLGNAGYEGIFLVEFNRVGLDSVLEKYGKMPLPPYIKEPATKEEYQTVYAEHKGSIAAPTAGFHFTPEIIKVLEEKGVVIVKVTLHVGYGTFRPVKSEDVSQHKMHNEWFSLSNEAAEFINSRTGRLVVVGTTSLRTVESASDENGRVRAISGETGLFIYPGYKWKLKPDGIITNFHLPKSTLLMLISAFAGRERILSAYAEAIKEKYRFFSFGDAMFINRVD